MGRGVSSSLALLASIMILTTQVCINLAFTEVISEEVMKRAREVVEEESFKQVSLVVVVNGSSLVMVNNWENNVLISSLSLYHLDGNVVDIKVDWCVPRKSVGIYRVPDGSELLASCIAVKLVLKEGGELLLPLSRV